MLKMLNKKICFAAVLMALSQSSFSSGIPVVDAAALTQDMTNFMQQFNQSLKDYQMLQDQLQKMKEQFSELQDIRGKLEGINSFADVFNNLELSSSRIIKLIDEYLSSPLANERDVILDEVYAQCEGLSTSFKQLCEKDVQIEKTKNDLYKKQLEELKTIAQNGQSLYEKAKNAQTQKEISDAFAALQRNAAMFESQRNMYLAQEQQLKHDQDLIKAQKRAKIDKQVHDFGSMSKTDIENMINEIIN